jgi:hypothetical protein
VILSDDKKRARIAAVQTVLSAVDYPGKNPAVIGTIDSSSSPGNHSTGTYDNYTDDDDDTENLSK